MNSTTCKHFNGTENLKCLKGVPYHVVTPMFGFKGDAYRMPCFTAPICGKPWAVDEFRNNRGFCEYLELPAPEEVIKYHEHQKALILENSPPIKHKP